MSKNKKLQKFIGYLMYAVAIGMPLSNLPQINQVYSTKVVTGLSPISWVTYLILGLIPLGYAVVNKLKPLVISNVLWTIVNISMIYGIVIYSPDFLPKDFERLLLINNVGKAIGIIGMILISSASALYAADLMELSHGKKQTT